MAEAIGKKLQKLVILQIPQHARAAIHASGLGLQLLLPMPALIRHNLPKRREKEVERESETESQLRSAPVRKASPAETMIERI